tara:strand:- start:1479 stop:1778 length:300 start_codon:yes stop_codon:yes gene_type:complete
MTNVNDMMGNLSIEQSAFKNTKTRNLYYISNDNKSIKRLRKDKAFLIYPISHFSKIKTSTYKFKVKLQNCNDIYYRPANGKTVHKNFEKGSIFIYNDKL